MSAEPELSRQRSMQDIDPSPVEDTPQEQRDSYFPPKDEGYQSKAGTIFGHDARSLPWYLMKVQRYSSYAFTVFAAMHITNTAIIPLVKQSVPASEPYLLLTRPYYQSPLAEPIVVAAPLIAHIGAGVAMRLYRRHTNLQMYGAESRDDKRKIAWPAMSGTSKLGYLFLPLLAGHVFINRAIPIQVHGGSSSVNLSYVSHAFAKHPAISFFGFATLIVVGVSHTTWGMAKWLRLAPTQIAGIGREGQLAKKKRWWLVNATTTVIAGIWLAGGLGVIGRGGEASGWVAREYEELYKAIPLIGKWM
ncbi:hypothetical protein K461DRAFT_273284 [Myriangium duriaei CBS 260.36]|uniref:Mitochondrial adapter protein MCP1 transmembrane domain-containing protein n=1 Tax=Myriangium duriaei CBS 260.36 TaxID=1168546 RepID=A0A9P4J8Z0_9PEZI|nr:hypothetical protein K461DRAFT_273284 [Myriangium duriaei CBS 260.36]